MKQNIHTGCNSDISKKVQVNILKEPLLVQKQRIHQKKALDISFLETESLRAWHYQEDTTPHKGTSLASQFLEKNSGKHVETP